MPEFSIRPDPEVDNISNDSRPEGTGAEVLGVGAGPGGGPGTDDAFFRSLFLPVDEVPVEDAPGGEERPGTGGAPPWAVEATTVLEAPVQPEDPRRAHFVGAPKQSRRKPVPAPVIRGIVGVAAVLALLLVVVLVTGGDSPDAVTAEGSRRALARAIPTLPLGTVGGVLPTTETLGEEPVPATVPATGARKASTGGSTATVDTGSPGTADPGTGTTVDTTPATTVDTTPATTIPPPPTTVDTTPPTTVDTTPPTTVL